MQYDYKFKGARGGGKYNSTKKDAKKNKEKVYNNKFIRMKLKNKKLDKSK